MRRRDWLCRLASGLLLLALGQTVESQDGSSGPPVLDPNAPGNEFETNLRAGLKARRPEEIAFVQLVVQKVKNDELPLSLVRSTFLWARRQPRYPAFYFEQGLRTRAAKEGISLDD